MTVMRVLTSLTCIPVSMEKEQNFWIVNLKYLYLSCPTPVHGCSKILTIMLLRYFVTVLNRAWNKQGLSRYKNIDFFINPHRTYLGTIWIQLVDFPPFFMRHITFVTYLLSCTWMPFGKGDYFKRKDFDPKGELKGFAARGADSNRNS